MVDSSKSVSVGEHLAGILDEIRPLVPLDVPLSQALGLTLADDVVAGVDVPGFDNSAMDGYAVRSADVQTATPDDPARLTVVADVAAGSAQNPALAPGTAARITTGAVIPDDAELVIPLESTDEEADGATGTVTVFHRETGRDHIRRAGTDVQAGELVLSAGRSLNSRDVAAAAAVGRRALGVHPAPRVAVLATGSELVSPGERLTRGRIHDSNSYLLEAAVREAGGVPIHIDAVPDDTGRLLAVLESYAGRVDAFVTSGGVSVGAYDVVKAALAPLSGVRFVSVRMQPGKPQGFGRWLDGTPIFALPGNPVSVFVSFETFVRPALRRMRGLGPDLAALQRATVPAVAGEGWRSPLGRTQYLPITVFEESRESDDRSLAVPEIRVRPASHDGGSHLVTRLAKADGVAIVPEDVTEVRTGDTVAVMLLT